VGKDFDGSAATRHELMGTPAKIVFLLAAGVFVLLCAARLTRSMLAVSMR
jgi:hypothetical protein